MPRLASPLRPSGALTLTAMIAGLGGAFPFAAHAAPASSVAAGREIAMNVCSACHQVAAKQEFPPLLDQRVPSFQTIADNPATTMQSLRRYITTTHWDEKAIPMTMPDLMLQPDQANAVARYILSLRTGR